MSGAEQGDLAGLGHAVRVARGKPDDVELAALVAGIVAARSAGGAAPDTPPDHDTEPWRDHARRLGITRPGPDAWAWSARRR